MIQKPGEGIAHLLNGFDAVVEYNHRTAPGVLQSILQTLFGRGVSVEIPGQHRPQNKTVLFVQKEVLRGGKATVRRAEEGGLKIGFTAGYIFQVGTWRTFPPIQVVKGVVPDCMVSLPHLFENLRVLLHIIANHKKGRLHVITVENGEDLRGYLRDGAVIEGKIDDLFLIRQVAHQVAWTQPPQEKRGIYTFHGFPG